MRVFTLINILIVLVLASCSTTAEKNAKQSSDKIAISEVEKSPEELLVDRIENAHAKNKFLGFEVVQFNMTVTFGGKERFDGLVTMRTDGSKIKMEDKAAIKYWDNKGVILVPDSGDKESALFTLLTWSYFFSAPYKLSDKGTHHENLGQMQLVGANYEVNKLSFGENVGESPDDWYMIYKDNHSDLLAAMSYIVTSGETSVEEAEKDPHAITYEAYVEVEGIPFASQWNFWTWNMKGELDKLLGSATINNIQLIKKAGDLFDLTAV